MPFGTSFSSTSTGHVSLFQRPVHQPCRPAYLFITTCYAIDLRTFSVVVDDETPAFLLFFSDLFFSHDFFSVYIVIYHKFSISLTLTLFSLCCVQIMNISQAVSSDLPSFKQTLAFYGAQTSFPHQDPQTLTLHVILSNPPLP